MNKNLLINFYKQIKSRATNHEGELWRRLDKNEQADLLNAFEESEKPENLIDHDEMKEKHRKWL